MTVAHFLSAAEALEGDGWEINGLDIGEVEITAPSGQRFRLTVEEIKDDEVG